MNRDLFPRVTAVLCTGLPGRETLAKAAIRSFFQQSYPNRDLLIFNHSKGEPYEYRLKNIMDEPPPEVAVREILVDKFPTLGEMRSAALDELDAGTKFVVQWDDDDWSHPQRIAKQMTALHQAKSGSCCVLGSQIRYSVPRNTAFRHNNQQSGIAGTILFPNNGYRYQAEHGTEDSTFLKEHFLSKQKCAVLYEPGIPELYLRFFHSGNICSEEHVMKIYARPRWHGVWVAEAREGGWLPLASRDYLLNVLVREYGRLDLPAKLKQIRCIKCKKIFIGEVQTEGTGRRMTVRPPARWRRVWVNSTPGEEHFLGVCKPCS
jgi:hypothetical protein